VRAEVRSRSGCRPLLRKKKAAALFECGMACGADVEGNGWATPEIVPFLAVASSWSRRAHTRHVGIRGLRAIDMRPATKSVINASESRGCARNRLD